MKKNHFYIAYQGNKREEVEYVYDNINFSNVDTIIEPFCGSCAVSYYIWLNHPNLTFILNDSNKFLYQMFNIYKDEVEIDKLNNWYNNIIIDLDKTKYNEIIKNNDLYGWFLKFKYYSITPGRIPLKRKFGKKKFDLRECPIYDFFKNANITFLNTDGINLIDEYKNNPKVFMFLDPPYINANNTSYDYKSTANIYEYFFKNKIDDFKCQVLLILENNWLVSLLFKNNIIFEYDKIYQITHKNTIHCLISNTKNNN